MTEVESNPWCFVHFDTVEEMFEAIENSRATKDEYVKVERLNKCRITTSFSGRISKSLKLGLRDFWNRTITWPYF